MLTADCLIVSPILIVSLIEFIISKLSFLVAYVNVAYVSARPEYLPCLYNLCVWLCSIYRGSGVIYH